jgi:transposase
MENENQDDVQVEIREHSDEDFYPEKCPLCGGHEINRHTYKFRTIQELGAPKICRRIRYEKITFKCKKCKKTFGIVHPLMPFGRSYMPSIVDYAVSRVLKKGDSVRRVTSDLNELHLVEVSIGKVEEWINEAGDKGKLKSDFSNEKPPENFSGHICLDGTFKSATTKKNSHKTEKTRKK